MNDEFKVGLIVKHKLTNEKCMIIRKGKEQYLVRTGDYQEVWVYDYEIELIK